MEITQEALLIIKEFNRNVRYLKERDRKQKRTWVKCKTVKEVTGWSHEQMRKARQQGLVDWKKDNGVFYDLDSIPEHFKLNNHAKIREAI